MAVILTVCSAGFLSLKNRKKMYMDYNYFGYTVSMRQVSANFSMELVI